MSLRARRPRIAINCDYDPGKPGARIRRKATVLMPYVEAVIAAGGLPLLVPPSPLEALKEYLALADGFLFTGGLDYPPAFYGQKPRREVVPLPKERAESDRRFMRLVLDSPKPALGICAGLQLLNIAKGGALIQHLPNAPRHTALGPEKDNAHPVALNAGTRLRRLFGTPEMLVNSAHHQAADPARLAPGLRIAAQAHDGTIEALELKNPQDRFFVFVQWHPERILDENHKRRLFKAFIAACAARLK